jgi:hypothetical protein
VAAIAPRAGRASAARAVTAPTERHHEARHRADDESQEDEPALARLAFWDAIAKWVWPV